MDQTTASYYRAILHLDSQDQRPLPQSLVRLHMFVIKRWHALGLGGQITKQGAVSVAMDWMIATTDGREFLRTNTSICDLFGLEPPLPDEPIVAILADGTQGPPLWEAVPLGTEVVVTTEDGVFSGSFRGRRGGWLDVRVGSNAGSKAFRASQVQLATTALAGAEG